jgi:hypothetical protein
MAFGCGAGASRSDTRVGGSRASTFADMWAGDPAGFCAFCAITAPDPATRRARPVLKFRIMGITVLGLR